MRNLSRNPVRLSESVEPRVASNEQRALIRTGVFLLSIAIGSYVTRTVCGLWHASASSLAIDHGKAKSLMDALLHLLSGFSRD